MIAIIDNDVILKLARWDLLEELKVLLGGNPQTIFHLPTCVHALCGRPARMVKTGCDPESASRIREFCDQTQRLSPRVHSEVLELLAAVPEIDPGEVQIFAVASAEPTSFTYMCDKRSLVALSQARGLRTIAESLAGRVKCLEQVMAELILQEGIQEVGLKVMACNPIADQAITIAFKKHPNDLREEVEIWEALQSYYRNLQGGTGVLLAPFPTVPAHLATP